MYGLEISTGTGLRSLPARDNGSQARAIHLSLAIAQCVTLAESAGVSRTSLGWSVWISEVHRERFKNHGILGLEALLLFSFR